MNAGWRRAREQEMRSGGIHGDAVRWYREQRWHLTQRDLAAKVFSERGDRAAHMAIHRLEGGSSVEMTDTELRALENLAELHGDPLDLYGPVEWVIVRDPAEGILPFAGVLLTSTNESLVQALLTHGKSGVNENGMGTSRYLPRDATAQQHPAWYLERLSRRLQARRAFNRGPQGEFTQLYDIDFMWLGILEAHLRGDVPEFVSADAAFEHCFTTNPMVSPVVLIDSHLSRIEYLKNAEARQRTESYYGFALADIRPSDFDRVEKLIALRDMAAERQDARAANLQA